MQRGQKDHEDKIRYVDVPEVTQGLFPLHSFKEKKQENSGYDEHHAGSDRGFFHDRIKNTITKGRTCQSRVDSWIIQVNKMKFFKLSSA